MRIQELEIVQFHSHSTDKGWSLRHFKPQEIMGFDFAAHMTKGNHNFQ